MDRKMRNNQLLVYKNQIVKVVEYFEEFNMAEVIIENLEESIIVDISLLSPVKEENKVQQINIFRGRCN